MSALPIFEFTLDPKLRYAYAAHEAVLEAFQKSFKRQPSCGLFIGSVGDKSTQRSTVTARWSNGEPGQKDAEQLRALAETVQYT